MEGSTIEVLVLHNLTHRLFTSMTKGARVELDFNH
jgi:hypothetical protein